MIHNASHGSVISKDTVHLKLGVAEKRMHDPKGFIPSLDNFTYLNKNQMDVYSTKLLVLKRL